MFEEVWVWVDELDCGLQTTQPIGRRRVFPGITPLGLTISKLVNVHGGDNVSAGRAVIIPEDIQSLTNSTGLGHCVYKGWREMARKLCNICKHMEPLK